MDLTTSPEDFKDEVSDRMVYHQGLFQDHKKKLIWEWAVEQ